MSVPTYLIAGATGFIGRRLTPALLAEGARVRALVRDADRGRALLGPSVGLHRADLLRDPDLDAAMEGVDCAYFLVHMLGAGPRYVVEERVAAEAFATAARTAGVGRVVYLGGLGADRGGSPHLDSRHASAEALREHGPPLTYIRAAMIVGNGSASYELLRAIATSFPVLPEPEWLRRRTQPIGIRDVIAYLREAPRIAEASGREVQIGGPDALEHLDVIATWCREAGRRPPRRLPMPGTIASPDLVAAAAAAVSPENPELAAELSLGLAGDTVVTDPSGAAPFPIRPESLTVAIQRALAEEEREAGRRG